MAWVTKYRFKFDSAHGVEYRILIQKDGYSGSIIKRRLGRGPVLKKQKNGPICGTSLEIYAECTIDGEFAQDFFTSNPKDLRVRLYRGNNLIWTGFVSAETYSEPNIAPPYDVQIVATDGLGELKLVTFVPAGAVTLSEHFRTALSYAGEGHTIYVASALIMTGQATTATFGMSINLDYLADKSYYDVLTALLDSLHATITMYNGNWLIARETDLSSLLSGSGLSVVQIAANGTVSTTTLAGVAKTVGSLADNTKDTWPVGYLSTAIEPARREVTVEAPWHTVSGPADPSMEATTGSPWITEGQVTHNTTDDCYYELGLNQSDPTDRTWGTIKQEIPINKLDCGFELKLRVSPRVYKLRQGDTQWYARGLIKVHLEYDLTVTQTTPHTTTYIGTEEGWSGAPRAESDPSVDIPVTELDSIGERWLSVDIPAIATPDSSSRYLVSDTAVVRIVIEGYWVDVYECIITPTLDLPGYQDVITINNGARGAENAVEITGGRVRSDNLVNNMFYGGIWLYGGVPVTSFADSQNQGGDFLAIAALSYASSVANARLRTEGSINVPADFANLPLFLTVEDVPAWLETWDWDLLGDEVQLSLLSLPANQITVESETVTGLPEGYSGGSGRGSGSGSSAASSYSYKSGGSNYFEEDGEGGIRLKDDYNGLTIPGFIKSTGDQIVIDGDPGGGGGGGATPYLYELQDVVITNVSTGQMLAWNGTNWVNVNAPAGTITSVALEQGGSDGTIHLVVNGAAQADVAVKGLDANLTVISGALQSLQSQIDAVASRNNYDELTATALFSDTIASPDAYIDVLHIGSAKIWWDSAKNALRIDKALVTEGDQIVIDGTPGGGGSGGALYLNELLDVTITNPSSGQALLYQNGVWVNSTVDFSNYYTKSEIDTMASRYVLGTRLDADEGVISDALRSLQAQIDAVASRNNFDELTASAVFSDTVSASAMYAGALTLGGYSFNGADINEAIAKANTAYQKPSTGIPNADIESPWVKVGTTQISLGGQQTSLAGLVNVTMSGKLTIGSAEIEWVPGENGNPGYLKVNSAFVTEGDQIIISGTPGGGGSAAAYLYELDDVSDALSSPATGDVLQYNGTEWVGVSASTIGGVTSVVGLTGNISTTQIADALTAAGYALTDTIVTSLAWSAITGKPTTLSGYGITDAATASEMTTVSAVLQSLQSQIDSVSARNAFDELVSTAIFADTLSASNAYLNRITGDLAGNADTASRLVSASYSAGGTYQPVYFSYGLPVACSYAIYSALYNGTAGRLAYYSGANLVSDYYGSVGSGVNPMYLSSGVPTASSDTAGSASLPVYLNAGTITACTASSMFSALGSNLTNNLEVTIFGQLRYISDLYATYDGEGEVIGDKFTIVSNALRSLQGQIDSVAARQGFDTLNVVNGYFDMISVGGAVGGNLHVIGTFSTTGDQVVTSDATKKTCLRDISLSVEQIAGAPAVTFDWKAGGHSFGSIAQYWKGVLPESVLGPEGDYSLAYGQLALVSSIVIARRETEQDREIKRLKERVALLENKVEQLTIN